MQELRGPDARPRARQVLVAVGALRRAAVPGDLRVPLEDDHLAQGAQLIGDAQRTRGRCNGRHTGHDCNMSSTILSCWSLLSEPAFSQSLPKCRTCTVWQRRSLPFEGSLRMSRHRIRQLASSKNGAVTAAAKMPATLPPITIALLDSFGGAAALVEGALAVQTQRRFVRELRASLATAGCNGARASGQAKYLVWAMVRSERNQSKTLGRRHEALDVGMQTRTRMLVELYQCRSSTQVLYCKAGGGPVCEDGRGELP